jgi:hypothetical protein
LRRVASQYRSATRSCSVSACPQTSHISDSPSGTRRSIRSRAAVIRHHATQNQQLRGCGPAARERLRRSRQISASLHVDHVPKQADARLWLADFLAGAYVGAQLHAEAEPWDIAGAAHAIEVVTLP